MPSGPAMKKPTSEMHKTCKASGGGRPAVAMQRPAHPRKAAAVARHMWSEARSIRPPYSRSHITPAAKLPRAPPMSKALAATDADPRTLSGDALLLAAELRLALAGRAALLGAAGATVAGEHKGRARARRGAKAAIRPPETRKTARQPLFPSTYAAIRLAMTPPSCCDDAHAPMAVARIEAGKSSPIRITISGLAGAAKKPDAAHAAVIAPGDEARPKAAVEAPESAKARTSGSVRPNRATVRPSRSWPAVYARRRAESMRPSAATLIFSSNSRVVFTTDTGLRAR
eukprot:scaffold26962_cov114-Isochrysis_galbana.AAC.12